MSRLPKLSDKEVERVLRQNGLVCLRKGTHGNIWLHPDDPTRRTQVPDRKELAPGTLQAIIRDSKKTRDEFMR
jgi:predicted RNA binding protein YcfA (HicA-like mRNA interferase family)